MRMPFCLSALTCVPMLRAALARSSHELFRRSMAWRSFNHPGSSDGDISQTMGTDSLVGS